ncbi:MAG: DUF1127 domain-containing protein [Sneathiella sp.]
MSTVKLALIIFLNKSSNWVLELTTTCWYQLGDYLQRQHQKQRNNRTCRALREHDEYQLRDIGLTRDIVKEFENSSSNTNVALELETFRRTKGRDLS